MNPGDAALCAASLVGCAVKKGTEGAVSSAASNGFKQAAETIFAAYDDVFKQFMTSWVNSGFLVSLDNKATKWFQDTSLPITVFLLVIGLVIAGARVMYNRRGEPFRDAMQDLGKAIAVITLGTSLIQVLVWGGDAYGQWVLKVSGTTATDGIADSAFAAASPGLALIFGLIGALAVGLQWVIMYVRQALMLLLNAFWQVVAASALLQKGKQAFEKITAWILAFILYLPIAASIYAFAWRLKNGQDGAGGVIYGLMLIGLAVIALPAMMRLLVPAAGAIGSAVGGAMAIGMVAGAIQAGVAVGAAIATGGASAGASGAGAGSGAAGVAEGGEVASGGGGGGTGGGGDSSSLASGMTGDGGGESGGPGGMIGGSADGAAGNDGGAGSSSDGAAGADSAPGSSTSTAGGADSSGQSSGSKAGWAAAQSTANGAGDEGKTAEGMISD